MRRKGTSGLYEIRHLATGKRYVGQSMAVEVRLRDHVVQLRAGKHTCVRLQRAFWKYGQDAFVFRMLSVVPEPMLDAEEQKLLDEGFAVGNLYNTARCAEAPARGTKHSEARKAQASVYRKKLFANPEYKAAHTATIKAGMTEEVRAKIAASARADSAGRSERMKERRRVWQQDGTMNRAAEKRGRNDAWKRKVQERARNWRSNSAMVAAHNESCRRRSENPTWRQHMREMNQGFAKDPAWRAAIVAGHRTDAARANHGAAARATHARLRADPVRYAAWKRRISESKKARRAECQA
jgi:group I intron endonuclease